MYVSETEKLQLTSICQDQQSGAKSHRCETHIVQRCGRCQFCNGLSQSTDDASVTAVFIDRRGQWQVKSHVTNNDYLFQNDFISD